MLELTRVHQKTKPSGVRIPAKVIKAFDEYRKNLCVIDYENDVFSTEEIIESWILSFENSEEFKAVKQMADEKRREKENEKEEKRKKEIERLKSKLEKLEKGNKE